MEIFRDHKPTEFHLFRFPGGVVAQVYCVPSLPPDLAARMAAYRTVIRQKFPTDLLYQYVIVIGNGSIRSSGEPVDTGVLDGLNVLHLNDVEPEWFGNGSGFDQLSRIEVAPTESTLLAGAGVTLDRLTMSDGPLWDGASGPEPASLPEQIASLYFYGRFGDGPEIPPEARHRGWTRAIGLALTLFVITDFDEVRRRIGQRQGTADVLADVLTERFGEDVEIRRLAYQLAGRPDLNAVIQLITSAGDLDHVRANLHPEAAIAR